MLTGRATTALVTALALALAGCGNSGSGAARDRDSKAQDPKAQLEIWVRKPPGSPTEATAKAMAARFTGKTGIPTRVTALFDDFETKLQQAAAARKLPDLVINDTAQLGTMVKQGILREVDRAATAGGDRATPISWDAAKGADGRYYAVPFSAQSFALFIRSDWRKRVGAAPPASWDDLSRLAADFTTGDPDGNGKADTYGMDVPGSTKRGYMSWFFTSFLWAGGGDYFHDNGGRYAPAIADDAAVASVTWFKGLFCAGKVVQPGAVTAETTAAHQAFETGKAGIYLTGPYNMSRFDKNLGKDRYEVVPLPAGPSGKATSLAEGENVYLMAGSANEAGQRRFAEFALSAEGQAIGMAGDSQGNMVRLPVNADVRLGDVRKDTRWQIFAEAYAKDSRYVPAVPDFTPFRQRSAETINALVADCGSDVKAGLTKLAGTFRAELAKQGVGG